MTQRRYLQTGWMIAILLVTPALAATPVSQLPAPGCYQVDWSATNTTSSNGQPSLTQIATIDGATGNYRHLVTPTGGQSIVSEQAGTGPYLRAYRPSETAVSPNCPTVHSSDNGQGAFDIKIACETFWIDPARLTFTKLPSVVDQWQITANSVMTSQVGLNNLPTALRETTAGFDAIYANARPKTVQEQQQVQQMREGLARFRQQAGTNAPAIGAQRRALEARMASASPQERVALRGALDGVPITQTSKIVEIWTRSALPCSN